jgi:hypothetical protein
MTYVIDRAAARSVASAFMSEIASIRKLNREFGSLSADDVMRATIALAECVAGYETLGGTYVRVGDALAGARPVGETAARESARRGFGFVVSFEKFDGLKRVPRKTTTLKRGVGNTAFSSYFVPSEKSRITAVLHDVKNASALGLSASPFSDYGFDGYNVDGLSFSNVGTHDVASVSPLTLAGLNAVQRQGYRSNAAMALAADVFAKLAIAAPASSKSARVRDTKYISALTARGSLPKGMGILATEPLDADRATRYADGARFVVVNGVAYVRYVADRAKRQYAVGSFSHFDTVVLLLALPTAKLAMEKLDDVRLTRDAAVDAVRKFADGDVRALDAFWFRETGKTRGGKLIVRSSFDFSAFAAAVSLSVA